MNNKVLFLALWFLPQVGGMEMSSYEIVSILKDIGYEVCVITADHDKAELFDKEQTFEIRRAKDVYLKNLAASNKILRLRNYFKFYHCYYKLVKKTILEYKPNIVIVADEQTRNWFGFYAQFLKVNPIVIVSMPENKRNRLKTEIVKRTLNSAKSIYCVSNATKNSMCDVFGEKYRNKMSVLYRSISPSLLTEPINIDRCTSLEKRYDLKDKFVILSVCRLNKKKGIDTLLFAIDEVRKNKQNFVLLIVGNGPDKDRLEKIITDLELQNHVILCGQIERNDIISFYDVCNIFVLPSIEESFGRVYVEAGARKKPSIGCAVGGVIEVIDNNVSGILVPPNAPKELANKIIELMNNDLLCRTMGNIMHRKVLNTFSRTVLTSQWKNIIEGMER